MTFILKPVRLDTYLNYAALIIVLSQPHNLSQKEILVILHMNEIHEIVKLFNTRDPVL
jgi:hypothetical protein